MFVLALGAHDEQGAHDERTDPALQGGDNADADVVHKLLVAGDRAGAIVHQEEGGANNGPQYTEHHARRLEPHCELGSVRRSCEDLADAEDEQDRPQQRPEDCECHNDVSFR